MTSKPFRPAAWLGALEFRFLEAALAVLVVVNGVGVASRYVFNHAIGELFEAMLLLSVAAYWLGVATAERMGGHLGMSLFVSMVPAGPRRALELLRKLVILGFLAVVVYSGVRLSMTQFRYGTASGLLGMPLWTVSAFLPLGCALLGLRILLPSRREDAP